MTVGILGGGQLARMIALAGYPLAQDFVILDPSSEAGAIPLGKHLCGAYDDPTLLSELSEQAEIVTYEFENVPASAAKYLSDHTTIYPPSRALEVSQDRLTEKEFFNRLDIQTAPFSSVDSLKDLQNAMDTLGYPAILKSRRLGYDGKGQILVQSAQQLPEAWDAMRGVPSIVEGFVSFQREISMIAARSPGGEIVFYPVSENRHNGGILRVSECRNNDPLQAQAEEYTRRLLETLSYVGIIALELFEVNGKILANEFAPRVHNSGHWTIEGAETSQFENHLRAILDLPLGSTRARGFSGMVNFIGNLPRPEQILSVDHAHLHLYDKSARKGRKVAHATVRSENEQQYQQSLQQLIALADQCDDS